jgi:Stress-induced bacterial acidophilic repeat motif
MPTNNPNPGNFANRPKEEVKAIASKGGKSGTENKGFASQNYDNEKHVRKKSTSHPLNQAQWHSNPMLISPYHILSHSTIPLTSNN